MTEIDTAQRSYGEMALTFLQDLKFARPNEIRGLI